MPRVGWRQDHVIPHDFLVGENRKRKQVHQLIFKDAAMSITTGYFDRIRINSQLRTGSIEKRLECWSDELQYPLIGFH